MRQSIQNSLPYDIALSIASSLPACDVCSLGSCSKYWKELCGSDGVWKILYRHRWPHHHDSSSSSASASVTEIHVSGWKGIYKKRHNETAYKASELIKFVDHCSSIEVSDYLSVIRDLSSMKFEFKDVDMFLFRPNLNVFLNLVGLHYCIAWLEVPADELVEALENKKISEREICVRWWKLGRWFHGFRLRDETRSRQFSLIDFANSKENEILSVLHRGAIHEVLRVQISVAKPISAPWSCQSSHSLA